ncbi:Uncharacterised protein [uncultured archaeon]|nr:Uncharacterised protein [uncultured archaeon]
MWLLPSKHADAKLKKTARLLASLLPGASFFPRGERSLERFQELAEREAEETILVLSQGASGPSSPRAGPAPSFILRSRHFSGAWSWDEDELVISHLEAGEKIPPSSADSDEPYLLKAQSPAAKFLSSFLGLRPHPLASYYDDLPAFELEAKEKKGGPAAARLLFEGEPVLSFHYVRGCLCEKKE